MAMSTNDRFDYPYMLNQKNEAEGIVSDKEYLPKDVNGIYSHDICDAKSPINEWQCTDYYMHDKPHVAAQNGVIFAVWDETV